MRGAAVLNKSQLAFRNYIKITTGGELCGEQANSVSAGIHGIYLTSGASATGNAVFANGLIRYQLSMARPPPPRTTSTATAISISNIKGWGPGNDGVVGVNATNNYWGAPSGPGAGTTDTVCNYSGGVTRFTPFATKPFTVKVLKP